MATDIIAITKVVKNILIQREHVNEKKIHLIHHGFLLQDFVQPPEQAVDRIKQLYNPNNQYPVIGMISRYIEWKGIQYSIPAFEKILESNPDALLILANAKGNYTERVNKMLSRIPKKNYKEITFESDIFALYKLFDVFVHVPITSESEAFGQTYVEALAAGVPSVFTLSGIANDFIIDHENAIVVPCKDSDAILNATKKLLTDKALSEKLINRGRKDVNLNFGLHKMINSLEELYAE
jgi:glycosyltransferase involved in cell wall biosynthesis